MCVDAGDNGTLTLWDYNTGTAFQNMDDIPQPGSLEAEAGVFCSTFDATGTRLITGGADKTIKVRSPNSPLGDTSSLIVLSLDLRRAITVIVILRLCTLYMFCALNTMLCVISLHVAARLLEQARPIRIAVIVFA